MSEESTDSSSSTDWYWEKYWESQENLTNFYFTNFYLHLPNYKAIKCEVEIVENS